jgi:hypothetical protein
MLILVVAVAFATAVVSANAQSSNTMRSQVPFEFIVGNKTLPAGEYKVSSPLSNNAAVMIRSTDGENGVVRLTNSIGSNADTSQAKLVFHRYGDKYFLAEIWSGADSTGRVLLKSKQEKALRREYSAVAQATYEMIEILAMVR